MRFTSYNIALQESSTAIKSSFIKQKKIWDFYKITLRLILKTIAVKTLREGVHAHENKPTY